MNEKEEALCKFLIPPLIYAYRTNKPVNLQELEGSKILIGGDDDIITVVIISKRMVDKTTESIL